MPNFITKNEERTKQKIDFLAANRRPVTVEIEEEQPLVDSMILKVDRGDPVSKARTAGRVFIKWLSPLKGNDLIQSAKIVQVRFALGKYKLAFTSYYVGSLKRSLVGWWSKDINRLKSENMTP